MVCAMDEKPWLNNYEDGVPCSLSYPDVPLTRFLDDSASSFPETTAMIFAGRKFPYREVQEMVKALSAALSSLGVKKGDRVALLLPNSPPYVVAYYATLRTGGVLVNLNPLSVERELHYLLSHSEARTVIVTEALYPRISGI